MKLESRRMVQHMLDIPCSQNAAISLTEYINEYTPHSATRSRIGEQWMVTLHVPFEPVAPYTDERMWVENWIKDGPEDCTMQEAEAVLDLFRQARYAQRSEG